MAGREGAEQLSTRSQVKRVQFNFSREAYDTVVSLQNRLGLRTKTELFRRAISFMIFIVKEYDEGGKLIVERKDGTQVQVALVL
ncbi:MAG: hypothetical protein AAFV53_42595 [Myxococcota bacterium]